MTRLVVSADSSPQYYGYYLSGFEEVLGPINLAFSASDLPALSGPRDGMAVLCPSGRKVFIAADDHPTVNHEALEWCDVYGQINLDPANLNLPGGEKLIPIGPGFGTRWHGQLHATQYVFDAWRADGRNFAGPMARWRAVMRHQRQRLPLSAYRPTISDDHVLFFLASYWQQHPQANAQRSELWSAMQRCRGVLLEGGFVGAPEAMPTELRSPRSYQLSDYLRHTATSVVALNTPAVHQCLGWKMGEFLALGKAVVSLPLTHPMPGAFESGTHFVEVDTAEAAVEAVERLARDSSTRHAMELRARRYFDEWVSPPAVAKRVLREGDAS